MSIGMSPWAVAGMIQATIVVTVIAIYYRYMTQRVRDEYLFRIQDLEDELEDAKAEARRIEQEALRKRKIVTFEEADLDGLRETGVIAGNQEELDRLKSKVIEAGEVLGSMTAGVAEVGQRLSDTLERQMEVVNMVGRLGGTGGLPPELKEKAEEILDVFRTMDESLSGAYEELDKVESGLGEVQVVVTDFNETNPTVKLPTAEILNSTLREKSGASGDAVVVDGAGAEEPTGHPPMDAFDTVEEEVRV